MNDTDIDLKSSHGDNYQQKHYAKLTQNSRTQNTMKLVALSKPSFRATWFDRQTMYTGAPHTSAELIFDQPSGHFTEP